MRLPDGAVLFLPLAAHTQHVRLAARWAQLHLNRRFPLERIARRRLPPHFFELRRVLKLLQPVLTLAVGRGHQVVQAPRPDLLQILLARHAAVHHHRLALAQSHPLVQRVQHLVQRRRVVPVAGHHFVRQREALPVHRQPHQHLFAVAAMVARVPPPGFRVGQRAALKVGRSDVVEKHRLIQAEQVPLALGQGRFDGFPPRMQFVQIAIQRVFGQVLKVRRPGCPGSAVERIQSGMASSLAGWIKRLSVIAQLNWRARSLRPACSRIASIPSRRQNW